MQLLIELLKLTSFSHLRCGTYTYRPQTQVKLKHFGIDLQEHENSYTSNKPTSNIHTLRHANRDTQTHMRTRAHNRQRESDTLAVSVGKMVLSPRCV